mgnify:CR=1 FL=1
MQSNLTRESALALLKTYNKEPFHIQHALTVEGVMRWYANELGYGADADYWATVGLLHDIDFENWPEEHCRKAPELLRAAGVGEDMIHSICSHGYGLCSDVEPVHEMEKVLFAADELTGLIGAEEVQGQEVRRRLLARRDCRGRAAPGLGADGPDGPHPSRHAELRGEHPQGDGGLTASAGKQMPAGAFFIVRDTAQRVATCGETVKSTRFFVISGGNA